MGCMGTSEGSEIINAYDLESPLETGEDDATIPSPEMLASVMSQYSSNEVPQPKAEIASKPLTPELTKERDEALLAQFNQTYEFQLPHEVMQYAMINPDGGHEERESDEWAVFIGGFASIKETYMSEMLDLAKSGKRVLFLSPDKGAQPENEDTDYFNTRSGSGAGTLPGTIRAKAAAVALLLEHLGVTQANVIGHSQGGAVATAFAGIRPKLVSRLLLDNPAGLIEKDTIGGLLHRVRDEAKVEFGASQSTATWWKQLKRLAQFPLFRATKEIPGIARTDIRPMLEHLKNLKSQGGSGPEVILINSNNDQLFPKEAVEAGIGKDALERYVDRWLVYADENANHGKVDRNDGELLIELTRKSVIHQIITEKPHLNANTKNAV